MLIDVTATPFYGGPLDGEVIIIPISTHYYYKPIPRSNANDLVMPESPEPIDEGIPVYKYVRFRNAMMYDGETTR